LSAPKIKSGDFKRLTDGQWKGKLTYQDYRSNKKVSILSNLTVTESSEDKLSWISEYEYPNEPKANKKSIVKISKDGALSDSWTIASKVIWKDSRHLSKVADKKPARGAAKFTALKSKIKVNQSIKENRLKLDARENYRVRQKQRKCGRQIKCG